MESAPAAPSFVVGGINFLDFILMDGDKVVVDSRDVAAAFGKDKDKVCRSVRTLPCSPGFHRANFGEVKETMTYANGGITLSKETKRTSHYTMTKDGFMFLVMGFTGKKAAAIKEAFIAAFNYMAKQLACMHQSLWQQRQSLELQDKASHVRASWGSRLMLDRKRELPAIRKERERLDAMIQPSLFGVLA